MKDLINNLNWFRGTRTGQFIENALFMAFMATCFVVIWHMTPP